MFVGSLTADVQLFLRHVFAPGSHEMILPRLLPPGRSNSNYISRLSSIHLARKAPAARFSACILYAESTGAFTYMSSYAQLTANRENADLSTGPQTPEGKAESSRNGIASLFTMHDFVRPHEAEEYAHLCASLEQELSPEGTLEQTYTAEIIMATCRLLRCSKVEANLAEMYNTDPMEDNFGDKIQRSVERARSHAHRVLSRSISELRKLQTNRALAAELYEEVPVGRRLAEHKQVLSSVAQIEKAEASARAGKRHQFALDNSRKKLPHASA